MTLQYVTAVGFDPGWAKTGIGAVRLYPDGRLECAGAGLVQTAPAKQKQFERLRASADDERRLREQWAAFARVLDQAKPSVVGVEVYTVYESPVYERLRDANVALLKALGVSKGAEVTEAAIAAVEPAALSVRLSAVSRTADGFRVQRGRGDAAKTYGVYAAVQCAAFAAQVPVYGFMPADLKKATCGDDRSKEAVEEGLRRRVSDLDLHLAPIAPSLRNHAADAVGHAMLAALRYVEWVGPFR